MFNKDLKERVDRLEGQVAFLMESFDEVLDSLIEQKQQEKRDLQPPVRISPRTGKPMREYIKKK